MSKSDEIKEFCDACKDGNIDFIKEYFQKNNFSIDDINQYETNVNDTPLHIASQNGHQQIVKILLEHGCDRSQLNKNGQTPYEVAKDDQIRQLFKRPSENSTMRRFLDDGTEDCFDLVKYPDDNGDEETSSHDESKSAENESTRTESIRGYKSSEEKEVEIGYATTSIALCQSKFGRFLADLFHGGSPMSIETMKTRLQNIIDKELAEKKDPQYCKAIKLLNKFVGNSHQEQIEYLIRIYTLETKFYKGLKLDPIPLALPLYKTLEGLKQRYFKGISYRGAIMDDQELKTYQWAMNNHGSLLQTRHFTSTSKQRDIAEQFLNSDHKKANNERHNPVLFTFDFPSECEQAINLCRISDSEPCLSEFEDEDEILVLPWTLFQVDNVQKQSSLYNIHLTNVPLPQRSFLEAIKWIITHPIGSIQRFKEHFPDKLTFT